RLNGATTYPAVSSQDCDMACLQSRTSALFCDDAAHNAHDECCKRETGDDVGEIVHTEVDARQSDAGDNAAGEHPHDSTLPISCNVRGDETGDDAEVAGRKQRVTAGEAEGVGQVTEECLGACAREGELHDIVENGRCDHHK